MASADAIPQRYIGSNDNESIYNITIEVLDGLLGDSDVTQQKLQQVEFNDDKFQLLSLEGIDFIGVADPKLREDITTISVQNNQLTTLVDLVALWEGVVASWCRDLYEVRNRRVSNLGKFY